MKILIDCFGCDSPDDFILGLARTINEIPEVTLVAAGERAYIERVLEGESFDRGRLEFLETTEVITGEDSPVLSIRMKTDASLVRAYRCLRDSEDIPIMITAGNTGAVIAGSVLILGRQDRETQPTLVTFLPNEKGGVTCLSDCGANVDCRPEQLLRFARFATEHMRSVYGIESPRVGLLSVGTEDEKGNHQTKEAFVKLKESELNFIGNTESKTALSGDVDVIVADGFAGNVLLKSIEGTAKTVVGMLTSLIKKHAPEGCDLSYLRSAVGELMTRIDFNSMGGAVILGAKKPVIKAHGSANSSTVINTVKQAIRIVGGQKTV
ncbi:MAG: phosphate acyltransferase PlsX [Clostridia bacterium]|nr:phosphate acyltransferase PlsX [Clostridia bacterium]MBQ8290827.1 phosphate acyltransferase PlsX [Clostridia bacterium]